MSKQMLHSAATPKKTLHITVNTDVPWYSMSPSVTMTRVGMSQTRSDKQILYTATTQFGDFKTGLSLYIMFSSETLIIYTWTPNATSLT